MMPKKSVGELLQRITAKLLVDGMRMANEMNPSVIPK